MSTVTELSARRPLFAALAVGLLALSVGGCERQASPLSLEVGASGTHFFAQSDVPTATMAALYTGQVVRDDSGCLRLATPDGHTVVWPRGFSLESTPDGLIVQDEAGDEVGKIGGSFRLGGGEVESLHDGLAISERTRERARDHCPGRYWIVGDA